MLSKAFCNQLAMQHHARLFDVLTRRTDILMNAKQLRIKCETSMVADFLYSCEQTSQPASLQLGLILEAMLPSTGSNNGRNLHAPVFISNVFISVMMHVKVSGVINYIY